MCPGERLRSPTAAWPEPRASRADASGRRARACRGPHHNKPVRPEITSGEPVGFLSVARPNRRLMNAALHAAKLASEADPLPTVDPATALQEIVNRLTARWRHACQQVDELGPGQLTVMTAFGPIDHEWIRAEQYLADRLARVCIEVERVGLAERMVALEESKAQLFVRALQAAAADVGIPRDKVKALGPALRTQLDIIQGNAQGSGSRSQRVAA